MSLPHQRLQVLWAISECKLFHSIVRWIWSSQLHEHLFVCAFRCTGFALLASSVGRLSYRTTPALDPWLGFVWKKVGRWRQLRVLKGLKPKPACAQGPLGHPRTVLCLPSSWPIPRVLSALYLQMCVCGIILDGGACLVWDVENNECTSVVPGKRIENPKIAQQIISSATFSACFQEPSPFPGWNKYDYKYTNKQYHQQTTHNKPLSLFPGIWFGSQVLLLYIAHQKKLQTEMPVTAWWSDTHIQVLHACVIIYVMNVTCLVRYVQLLKADCMHPNQENGSMRNSIMCYDNEPATDYGCRHMYRRAMLFGYCFFLSLS